MKRKFPRMYLSGFRTPMKKHKDKQQEYEKEWIKRTGVKYRCFNFAYIHPKGFTYFPFQADCYRTSVKMGVGIMMDSSAYSFWKFIQKQTGKVSSSKKIMTDEKFNKLKDETIDLYVEFCKEHKRNWDFYANFDYRKDCELIWQMQLELERKGLKPSPVYHGDSSLDYFRRYCDRGYKVICIGGLPSARRSWKDKRRFLERLFNIAEDYKVGLHGFAMTSMAMLTEFPWFSVDSATWIKTSAYGMIVIPDQDRNILQSIHVSDRVSANASSFSKMPKSVQRNIKGIVENAGFNFDKIRTDNYERYTFNAYVYANLDKLIDIDRNIKAEWEYIL